MGCKGVFVTRTCFRDVIGNRKPSEDPTIWQLASLQNVSKGGIKTATHPMNSLIEQDSTETRLLSTSNSKAQFRDYEKRDNRRKSLCFPILDNCMIPEDCLELGQRLVHLEIKCCYLNLSHVARKAVFRVSDQV